MLARVSIAARLLLLLALSGLTARNAFAVSIVVEGLDGTAGAPGDPGLPGGDGTDGEPATAIANAPDPTNSAAARGGDGGPGGDGGGGTVPGERGEGGDGGRGGDATAVSDVSIEAGTADSRAFAFGGDGGSGGAGGVDSTGFPAPAGTPGDGGAASGEASARTGSADPVIVDVRAEGGDGAIGGAATVLSVYGESAGGPVSARAVAIAGLSRTAAGTDVILTDAVDARTSGPVSLTQEAVGGATTADNLPGGNALSALTRSMSSESLALLLTALGGNGFIFSGNLASAPGGRASVVASATNLTGAVTVRSGAAGGNGGRASNGGDAMRELSVTTEGDGSSIDVRPQPSIGGARGGTGGSSYAPPRGAGLPPGRGGSAASRSIATALGDSSVLVADSAEGGLGGNESRINRLAGTGGIAESYAFGSNRGSSPVLVFATARGGSGGSAPTAGFGGAGGAASAAAEGRSEGGAPVNVEVTQFGGSGGRGGSAIPADGPGANASMVDAVRGATSGTLTLTQTAIGGASTTDAGDATSLVNAANPLGGNLVLTSTASAPTLGSLQMIDRLANAVAGASGTVIGSANVSVTATASAGGGGSATLAPVTGVSPGGDATVVGEARGGNADPGGTGPAPTTSVVNAVSGSAGGTLLLTQRAISGSGAAGRDGGAAISNASQMVGAAAAELRCQATGGAGGVTSSSASRRADGGASTAICSLANSTGSAVSEGFAQAGSGGLGTGGISGGDGGDAEASARAESAGDGRAIRVGFHTGIGAGPTGARGGHGGGGELGSAGGSGGDATSRSEGVALGNSPVLVRDVAIGGAGGLSDAAGGSGGNATSQALGSNAGRSNVIVAAEATGGRGRPGAPAGAALATARGVSTGGARVVVTATQTSGDGEVGADSQMTDAVSGSTSGRLELTQIARAGGSDGPAAGSAVSRLTARNEGGGSLVALSGATGGSGLSGATADGAGGSATAAGSALDTTGSSIELRVEAFGGGAGSNSNGPGRNGGAATIERAYAESTAGGSVSVVGSAWGGAGGLGMTGVNGDGASVELIDIVDGATSGSLRLEQIARGGSSVGDSGLRGSSTSRLRRHKSAAGLFVGATADDVASAHAINEAGPAFADARASVADARAWSVPQSSSGIASFASAYGATASAEAASGLDPDSGARPRSETTRAIANSASTSFGARAQVLRGNLQGGAESTAVEAPDAQTVALQLAANPRVAAGLDTGAPVRFAGIAVLSSFGALEFINAAEFSLLTPATSGPAPTTQAALAIGFLDPVFFGDSLESLRLEIEVEGTSVLDRTFLEEADAVAFLDDQLLELGQIALDPADPFGTLDVRVRMVTREQASFGSSAQMSFLVALVAPEPSAGLLLLTSIAGLVALRGRARS